MATRCRAPPPELGSRRLCSLHLEYSSANVLHHDGTGIASILRLAKGSPAMRSPSKSFSGGTVCSCTSKTPGNSHGLIKRIKKLMKASKWQQAWGELQPLLESAPRDSAIQLLAETVRRKMAGSPRSLVEVVPQRLAYPGSNVFTLEGRARSSIAIQQPQPALALSIASVQHARLTELLSSAKAQKDGGQRTLAIQTLEEAFALDSTNAQIAYSLASLHADCFDPTPALKWAIRAVKLQEDYWEAYAILGAVLQRLERYQEALQVYQSLLIMQPNLYGPNRNLGMMCLTLGLNKEAVRYLSRAAEVASDPAALECDILHQLLFLNDWSELESRAPKFLERLRRDQPTVNPFPLLTIPGTRPLDLKSAAERMSQTQFDSFASRALPQRVIVANEAERRLRVGYLSCDFHEHATGFLMARVFELHDRENFEWFAYVWDNQYRSGNRGRLVSAFDVVRDIRGLADEQAAELIRNDEIDIIVDLKGYTRDARLGIVAYRPAPVVAHHVGFPGTLGARFIDYVIADRYVAPPEHPEYFTENLAYLPDCYQPTDDTRVVGTRPSRADCGLPDRGVVFCSFNQSYKLTPDIFELWCGLLESVEGSVLWLLAHSDTAGNNLRGWAKSRGIAPERLIFAPKCSQTQHLGRLQNADLALDTFPVNSHTTASDALWAGVPIVTLSGNAFVSRVAGSILRTLGMPELIARDRQEYLQIARDIALHADQLQRVRQLVAERRMASALFDSKRYTRNLESLYRKMWRRRALALAPATLGE